MSGAIPVTCPPGAEAPEETTLSPLGQDTVPLAGNPPDQKYWLTYWMGLEAGTSADAGAADKANPPTTVPAAKAAATAIRRILMVILFIDGQSVSRRTGAVSYTHLRAHETDSY